MSPVTIAALPCTTPSYEQHPPFWGMGCPGAILMLLGLLLAIAGWLAILKQHQNLVKKICASYSGSSQEPTDFLLINSFKLSTQTTDIKLVMNGSQKTLPVLDLCCHCHKCLFNICGIFGTCLQKGDAYLICKCL
jgi:hypothetical protein